MKKLPDDLATKLLDASHQLPAGSGFDVSVDEVAQLADIPRATLYYYFSGKDDLVEFYMNDLMDRTRAAIQKAAGMPLKNTPSVALKLLPVSVTIIPT